MKRLTLILGAAAMALISTPLSARTQVTGCSWWDLTCNGLSTISDSGWHIAGRDRNGNVIYLRRHVDANGNVIVEQARRDGTGRYIIVDRHLTQRGTNRVVYRPNGTKCKYKTNPTGYKTQCKYPKTNHGYTVSRAHRSYRANQVPPARYRAATVVSRGNMGYKMKGMKVKGGKGKGPKY